VFGSIIDGVFEGKIISPIAGSFYVEKAKHYFPNGSHTEKGFHSIIYNEKHVDDPYNSIQKGMVYIFLLIAAFHFVIVITAHLLIFVVSRFKIVTKIYFLTHVHSCIVNLVAPVRLRFGYHDQK
jgi:hypothetical protein